MKLKRIGLPSIYDKKKFKRIGIREPLSRKIALGLLILFSLLIVRFLNLYLHWTAIRLELQSRPVSLGVNYRFLGFSSDNRAQLSLASLVQSGSLRVSAYYNLWQPALFFVHNGGASAFVDCGRVLVRVGPGFSRIGLGLDDRITLEQRGEHRHRYFGQAPLSPLLRLLAADQPPPSYLLRSPANSDYLRLPYLVYFFLPLVLILLLSVQYGGAIFPAFFYYAGFHLLFDFPTALARVPLAPLFNLLNWEPPLWLWYTLAGLIVLLFLILGILGIPARRKAEYNPLRDRMILFFLLLPLFLRF